jgi:hypothetical protein
MNIHLIEIVKRNFNYKITHNVGAYIIYKNVGC